MSGGGDLAALISAFDWSSTRLGAIETWPQSVKTTLSLILRSPVAIVTLWTEDGVMIYNDAYSEFAGARHPALLGSRVREGWPEVADFNDHVMKEGLAGRTLSFKDQALVLNRAGRPGQAWMNLDYSPILAEDGRPIGVMAVVVETTPKMMAERRLAESAHHAKQVLDGAIDYAIIALDIEGRITRWNEGARRILGWREEEAIGQPAGLFFTPEDNEGGRPAREMAEALEHGMANNERWHIRFSGERFWASGEMMPIRDEAGKAIGFVKVLRDRTSEHLTQSRLREVERRLRRAQEVGGVGLFSIDAADDVMQVTGQFCRIFGLPEADSVSVNVVEALIVPEDREVASTSDSRRQGSAPLQVEYRIVKADTGEERVVARRGEFERDGDGKILRLVGVVQDVTERRRAQRELRESEAKLRALTETLPNHVWTAKPDGTLDWVNERLLSYSGKTPEDILQAGWSAMIHSEDLDDALRLWRQAIAERRVYEAETRLRNAAGEDRWHITRAVPLADDKGQVERWIGATTDIHDLRLAREQLAALNATLEQRVAERTADRDRMWRLSTDVMLVADFEGRIMAVNPAWTSLLGWGEDELVGSIFLDLVHPDDLAATHEEIARLSDGATVFTFVNRYRARNGSYRRFSWTAVPDDRFIHAVGRDVTAEHEAADVLRRTETALQRAQKMEAIGNLTGGVAHDFNNLLQVISGNLQLLLKDLAGNERAERRVNNALAGVNRGSKLAAQLLAFGRRQALDPRVVNIGRLVQGMDEMVRRTIGEGVEVETVVSGGLWNTLVDTTQMENALLNLAINARDAMDSYGRLTIEVMNAVLDETYATGVEDVEPGDYVSISVSDTGSGIAPEILDKVFDPFFSTKAEGKGTGLGLSMVYGFVKQSGGHVRIYSEPGLGTHVRMYLPRAHAAEDDAEVMDTSGVVGGNETILVAEDDEGVRTTVVEMLQDLGYRVLKASDAASALSVVESGLPIDLLFTDVVMPGPLKSTEMVAAARRLIPGLAVLFTSGYTENSIVHGGRLDAGVQLLSKPYARQQLAQKVRAVLDQRAGQRLASPATPSVAAPTPAPEASADLDADHVLDDAAIEAPARKAPISVLLVEDDALIRMDTAEILEGEGYRVTEAATAGQALDSLRAAPAGTIDVLFTDLGLPDMSGGELARQVREAWPAIAIVFATGEAHAPKIEGGRVAFLQKPYTPRHVADLLADLVRA
ncbi:PAS domain S-box-containing protein [Xaviernesmea oryzae]|nr:PAS domain S-box-containing protein [Xaviernesmea oryzae]